MKPFKNCFCDVQGRDTLIPEQKSRFSAFSERISELLVIFKTLSGVDGLSFAVNEEKVQIDTQLIETRTGMISFLELCGYFT